VDIESFLLAILKKNNCCLVIVYDFIVMASRTVMRGLKKITMIRVYNVFLKKSMKRLLYSMYCWYKVWSDISDLSVRSFSISK